MEREKSKFTQGWKGIKKNKKTVNITATCKFKEGIKSKVTVLCRLTVYQYSLAERKIEHYIDWVFFFITLKNWWTIVEVWY